MGEMYCKEKVFTFSMILHDKYFSFFHHRFNRAHQSGSIDMHEVHTHFHAFCWSLLGGINHTHLTGQPIPHLFPLTRVVLIADFIQEVLESLLSSDEVIRIF